jgi:alanine racemase
MKRSSPHRITINDIAKRADVSKTAVSFAFNRPGRLSQQTTQHILNIARELGYTPNPIARSLNTRRTQAIGLLVPQNIPDVLTNPFFFALMTGIGQVCQQEGLSLLLVPPMRGSVVDATYAALIDGCIVTGLEPSDEAVCALRQRAVPFVMVDTDAPDDIASVNIDDFEGARLATQHLLELGHRHIAFATFESSTGKTDEYTGTMKHRFDGIRAALQTRQLSLTSPGIYTWECACNVAGGLVILERILQQDPIPTAVLALADVIAHGVIAAAKRHHLHIPHDLSVVGFDDLEMSNLIQPALTTVRQPILEKGRKAAELLVNMLNDMDTSKSAAAESNGNDQHHRHSHATLPVTLVVRDSTARLQ